MNKFAILTGVALVALTGAAHAADLIVDQPAAMTTPAADTTLYFELLGGVALQGTLDFYDPSDDGSVDTEAGGAIAGVVGFGTGIEGLSVEADAFYAQRDYQDKGDYTLKTGTLMADLKYTVSLNDTFGIYGAVGLGGVYLNDSDSDGTTTYVDGWGAGYLLKAGVTAKVADQISLVGEVRYANSFEPIASDDINYDDEQAGTTSVLVGVHFGF
ncbi:outer membrane beta-barrel protein [Devosia sp.]|uniref:outer membrane beta-barrel protein n=1 Tax=Devosia sp. TaxID=1871048 RepID=UPI003BAC0D0C